MAGKIKLWYANNLKRSLRHPQKGLFGWIALQYLISRNQFLEENAVKLCNIKPDHHVLEVGFGPGVGLESAYNILKDGKGKLYGIDPSLFMVETAGKKLSKALAEHKLQLFHGCASNIPLNTDSLHRVYHCNTYYFWPSMRTTLREIYRVMKPGGVMVTTLCIENLKETQRKGLLPCGVADPLKYMVCLEQFGFENVNIQYHKDSKTGKEFQAIFAEVLDKPAHDFSALSDDDGEEDNSQDNNALTNELGEISKNGLKSNLT